MNLYDFVVPLGIIGFTVAVITVILGFFKKILPAKPRVLVHKILGFALLLIAFAHGGIVLYFQFFA